MLANVTGVTGFALCSAYHFSIDFLRSLRMPEFEVPNIMSSLPSLTAAEPLSVFVADASSFDCELLIASLSRNHLRVLGWGRNSEEVVAGITTHNPDVAVISARLEDGPLAGLHATRELHRLHSATRTIILVDSSEPEMVIQAFRSGARGLFSRKDSSDLCKCIRCIHAGQVWAKHQELVYLIEALRSSPGMHLTNSKGMALLTEREQQVVKLVASAMSNRDIAKQLGLSEHTVKNYIFDIFEKLGISTRVELVLYALNHHSVE